MIGGDDYLDPKIADFFIGHPGSLRPVHAMVEPYDIDDDMEPILTKALGGGVRARIPRARASRKWKVDIPSVYPQDVAGLRHLLAATVGPYVWVDPWSRVTNMLTPEESTLASLVSPSQLAQGGGGWRLVGLEGYQTAAATRSNPTQGSVTVGTAPVPPATVGVPVTASAWIASSRTGGGRVSLQWLSGSGSVMSTVTGNFVSGMDGLRRSTATGVAPWGATSARVYVQYADVLSMPAITWTDGATPWDVGNGTRKVLVGGVSRSIRQASQASRLHDFSFTITEVGPPGVIS